MAQTNNLWSNLLLAATRQPRKLAGLLGIADPESYLTAEELRKNEQAKNWGIQAIADVTDPFAKGANILAQGYGDLYRGLSGNTDYVSPLESYIKSGISQESHQRIQDNPYKEILKSGAGMAATLAPMSTGGVFTNAATRGTRAFSGLNPSANPLVNQLAQIVTRGGLEGGLGGFGHSREGKELTDTLTGAGLGVLGEGVGEYVFNKNFRDLLNENVSRAYKMSRTPGTPMKYSDLLNGDITVGANDNIGWLDQVDDNKPAMTADEIRAAYDRGEITADEFGRYIGDPPSVYRNKNVSSPEIINNDELPNVNIFDDGDLAYSDLLKDNRNLNSGSKGGRILDEIQTEIEQISNAPLTQEGLDRLREIKSLYGNQLTGEIDLPLRMYEKYFNGPASNMDDQMKQLADRYKGEGIPTPGVKDGSVRQPDSLKGINEVKEALDQVKDDMGEELANSIIDINYLNPTEDVPTGNIDMYIEEIKSGKRFPIVVESYIDQSKTTPTAGKRVFDIVDGNHRYKAYKALGIKDVPIIVNKSGLDRTNLAKTTSQTVSVGQIPISKGLKNILDSSKDDTDFAVKMLDSWDTYRDELNNIPKFWNTAQKYQNRSVLDYLWKEYRMK